MSGLTLKLTDRQAKVIWDIIDGAADAGACDGGLTNIERRALEQITNKMLQYMLSRKKDQ